MATRPRSMATLGLALLLALATTAEAGPKRPPNNDFILRAPAAEIADIAFRNGLEVLDEVDASVDALGRSVYLVRAPLGLTAAEVLQDVGELEPEALNIEEVYLASLPELDQSTMALLDQSVMALLDSFNDTTAVEFDKDAVGEKRFVWTPYVNQPAAEILRVSEAQEGNGGDALVAIIDTGVDPSHPLFAHRLVAGYDFVNELPGVASEWTGLDQSVMALLDQSVMALLDQSTMALLDGAEFAQVNQSVMALLDQSVMALLDGNLPPAFGHGTMVAGVIHRVAPKARLMPLKAFDADGNGNLFDIVRAIYYAVDHGANVINMSFSVEVFSPELMRAVNYAAKNGVTCVASAGNRGLETMVYPSALGNVIGVASTDQRRLPERLLQPGDRPGERGGAGRGHPDDLPGRRLGGGLGHLLLGALDRRRGRHLRRQERPRGRPPDHRLLPGLERPVVRPAGARRRRRRRRLRPGRPQRGTGSAGEP